MAQADSLSEAEAAAMATDLLTNFIRFTWLTGLSLIGAIHGPLLSIPDDDNDHDHLPRQALD